MVHVISGYKVNTVLKCGWTPLMYAASSALPQIVKFLIDNGADPHSHKGNQNSEPGNHKNSLVWLTAVKVNMNMNINSFVLDIANNEDSEIYEHNVLL